MTARRTSTTTRIAPLGIMLQRQSLYGFALAAPNLSKFLKCTRRAPPAAARWRCNLRAAARWARAHMRARSAPRVCMPECRDKTCFTYCTMHAEIWLRHRDYSGVHPLGPVAVVVSSRGPGRCDSQFRDTLAILVQTTVLSRVSHSPPAP